MNKEREGSSDGLGFREQDSFRRVDLIEVKRCRVVSEYIRREGMGRRYLPRLTSDEFMKRLQEAKDFVLPLSEPELDEVVARHYKKRLREYNAHDWYEGIVYPDEVGVWKSAGSLAVDWTYGSLEETADKVKNAVEEGESGKVAARAKRAVFRMEEHLESIENEPYLYPIILPGATIGRGNKGQPYNNFRVMKGDIDDGCMRSIAFVNSGRKSIQAYVGIRK